MTSAVGESETRCQVSRVTETVSTGLAVGSSFWLDDTSLEFALGCAGAGWPPPESVRPAAPTRQTPANRLTVLKACSGIAGFSFQAVTGCGTAPGRLTIAYKHGTTKRVSKVEVTTPPMTARARGVLASPGVSAIGKR